MTASAESFGFGFQVPLPGLAYSRDSEQRGGLPDRRHQIAPPPEGHYRRRGFGQREGDQDRYMHIVESVFQGDMEVPLTTDDIARPRVFIPRQLSDLPRHDYSPSPESEQKLEYECFVTEDPDLIRRARQLTAVRYLERGFINADQINSEGVIADEYDPHHHNSIYYVVTDKKTGDIIATSRKIHYDPEKGEKSFPLWEHKDELDLEYVKRVEAIGLEHCIEISKLVRNPNYPHDPRVTLLLYRRLFQDAWNHRDEGSDHAQAIFLMANSPQLHKTFKLLFGKAIKEIGPHLDYPGEEVVPAYFLARESSVTLIRSAAKPLYRLAGKHKEVVDFMLEGADPSMLDPAIIEELKRQKFYDSLALLGIHKDDGGPQSGQKREQGVPQDENLDPSTVARNGLGNFWRRRKPELVFSAALIGWTALRTLGVAQEVSPSTHVDWRTFLGIELVTTYPYTRGMADLVRAFNKPQDYNLLKRAQAATVAGGCLLAPYVYVAAEGEGISKEAAGGVGVVALVSIAGAARKLRTARKKRRDQSHNSETEDSDS